MLESYVVKNKKRILALLNIPHDSVSSLCSMPCKLKKTDQFEYQKSCSRIPYNAENKSTAGSLTSPEPKSKENEKILLLNGNSDNPDLDYFPHDSFDDDWFLEVEAYEANDQKVIVCPEKL